jgi:predicted metal-dependent hydrolase
MSETLQIDELTFEVRRSERRRTLGLTVDRGGELVVHAPRAITPLELEKWIGNKLLWVHRKLAVKEELAPKRRGPVYVSGESFAYLGRSYRLAIVSQQEEPLRFDGRRFYLQRDARTNAGDHFRRWYVATGKDWLEKRVSLLARKTGRNPAQIEVKDLGFRWGSCGRSGVALFNWRLLQLPVRLVDYVIMHELTHLNEPHHGPTFWRALDRSLPDWRDRREELRVKALEVYWCRPEMMQ